MTTKYACLRPRWVRKWDPAPKNETPQRPDRKGAGAEVGEEGWKGTSLEERAAGVSGLGWRHIPEPGWRRTCGPP